MLIESLRRNVPMINPLQVIAAGATGLREAFPPDVLDDVVSCYMDGLRATLLLPVALACCAALASAFAPWVSIKGKIVAAAA